MPKAVARHLEATREAWIGRDWLGEAELEYSYHCALILCISLLSIWYVHLFSHIFPTNIYYIYTHTSSLSIIHILSNPSCTAVSTYSSSRKVVQCSQRQRFLFYGCLNSSFLRSSNGFPPTTHSGVHACGRRSTPMLN